jgi:hypothetical protein
MNDWRQERSDAMIRALVSVQADAAYGNLSDKTRAAVDAILEDIRRGGQKESTP